MRKAFLALIICVIAPQITASPNISDNSAPVGVASLFVYGGVDTPYSPSDFTESWKRGGNFGLGAGYKITRITTLLLDYHYSKYGFNKSGFISKFSREYDYHLNDVSLSGGDTSIVLVLGNAKLHFTGSDAQVKGYFIGGFGIGTVKTNDVWILSSNSPEIVRGSLESALTARLGMGLDIRLTPTMFFFLETSGIAVGAKNGTITYNLLNAGLKFDVGGGPADYQ